jgi:hypothetical protein
MTAHLEERRCDVVAMCLVVSKSPEEHGKAFVPDVTQGIDRSNRPARLSWVIHQPSELGNGRRCPRPQHSNADVGIVCAGLAAPAIKPGH